jgi:serine/threonine protein kinase
MPPDPLLGMRIRGYRLERLLGRGKATALYAAHSDELWQVPQLLVTILLPGEHLGGEAHERFRARFAQMAPRLSTLRHPFLFPLYGSGEQDGLCYLLTPTVSGELLPEQMRRNPPWTPPQVLAILAPLASALSYLHGQGWVYQFLQPASILLLNQANVQLTGLGLPQLLSLAGLDGSADPYAHLKTLAGTYLGAPHYLAPEVVRSGEGSPRSDVYSLGMLLCELLGTPLTWTSKSYLSLALQPPPAPLLGQAHPDLRDALAALISRALDPRPEQRFCSPDELVAGLAALLDQQMFATGGAAVGERADPPSAPRPLPHSESAEQPHAHRPPAHEHLLAMAAQLQQRTERLKKRRGD